MVNGTGKTILSDFLYDRDSQKYSRCFVDIPGDELLLVYNSSFIQKNFYEEPNQNGIFTLSRKNKTAEENIRKAGEALAVLEIKRLKRTNFYLR
jgi:hypothetical protein